MTERRTVGLAVGAFLVSAVLALSLLERVELIALGAELAQETDRIEKLEEEQSRLLLAALGGIDLQMAENYARTEGWQSPAETEWVPAAAMRPDRVTLLCEEQSGLAGFLTRWADKMGEYFS